MADVAAAIVRCSSILTRAKGRFKHKSEVVRALQTLHRVLVESRENQTIFAERHYPSFVKSILIPLVGVEWLPCFSDSESIFCFKNFFLAGDNSVVSRVHSVLALLTFAIPTMLRLPRDTATTAVYNAVLNCLEGHITALTELMRAILLIDPAKPLLITVLRAVTCLPERVMGCCASRAVQQAPPGWAIPSAFFPAVCSGLMAAISDFGENPPSGCSTNFGRICTHLVLRGYTSEIATAWWRHLLKQNSKNDLRGYHLLSCVSDEIMPALLVQILKAVVKSADAGVSEADILAILGCVLDSSLRDGHAVVIHCLANKLMRGGGVWAFDMRQKATESPRQHPLPGSIRMLRCVLAVLSSHDMIAVAFSHATDQWSHPGLQQQSLAHQYAVTTALGLCLKYEGDQANSELVTQLLGAIQLYFGSPVSETRAMGMRIAEKISLTLSPEKTLRFPELSSFRPFLEAIEVPCPEPPEPPLGCSDGVKDSSSVVSEINSVDTPCAEMNMKNLSPRDAAHDVADDVKKQTTSDVKKDAAPDRTHDVTNDGKDDANAFARDATVNLALDPTAVVSLTEDQNMNAILGDLESSDTGSESDSDDDSNFSNAEAGEESSDESLEPFDLTDDQIDLDSAHAPRYLRDCIEALNYVNDGRGPAKQKPAEAFNTALRRLPKLIARAGSPQARLAPGEDVPQYLRELWKPLIRTLLFLEDKYSTKGFGAYRRDAIIALCAALPREASSYLIRAFYSDNVNTGSRYEILETLQATAEQLSNDSEPSGLEKSLPISVTNRPTVKSSRLSPTQSNGPKTRRWGVVKPQRVVARSNLFAPVAASFFFPLLNGYDRAGASVHVALLGDNEGLLCQFITTLAIFISCSRRGPSTARMVVAFVQLFFALRFNTNKRVKFSLMFGLSRIQLLRKQGALRHVDTTLGQEMLEVVGWLRDIQARDGDVDCRENARKLLTIM